MRWALMASAWSRNQSSLFVGVVGVAGVVAVVPDAQAHLEEADGVGVAEVEVLQAGFDQGGHDGELWGQAAFFGFGGHPGGDLLLGGVVAGVSPVTAARSAAAAAGRRRRRRAAAGCGRLGLAWTAWRNSWESPGLAGRRGRRDGDAGRVWATRGEQAGVLAGVRRPAPRARRRTLGRGRRRRDGGGAARRRRRAVPPAASSGGQLEVGGDLLLEADVDVVRGGRRR